MLRLFCQQSCRRCACPFGGTTALALPLGGVVNGGGSSTGGSGSAPAVTAAAEPTSAPPVAASPTGAPAVNSSGPSQSPAANNSSAASPPPAANSSAASAPPASSETPQQQMVDPLFDALQSFASANGAANDTSGGGDSGPGGCRTDVLNFLR